MASTAASLYRNRSLNFRYEVIGGSDGLSVGSASGAQMPLRLYYSRPQENVFQIVLLAASVLGAVLCTATAFLRARRRLRTESATAYYWSHIVYNSLALLAALASLALNAVLLISTPNKYELSLVVVNWVSDYSPE